MTPVEFSVRARQDLAEIADYIAETNPTRAYSFVDELVAAGEARGAFLTRGGDGATSATTCSPSPTVGT